MPDIVEISQTVEDQYVDNERMRAYARVYPSMPERLRDIVRWLDANLKSVGLAFMVERIDGVAAAQGSAWSERFGLTPAEIRLSAHLMQGGTITGFAKARDLSRNTVRNQLQSVYSKTGAHRQAELMRLLLNTHAEANTRA